MVSELLSEIYVNNIIKINPQKTFKSFKFI